MTAYTILRRAPVDPADPVSAWHLGPTVEAHSPAAAIRKASESGDGGLFVAVPTRSWKPVRVTVETRRHVSFGDTGSDKA